MPSMSLSGKGCAVLLLCMLGAFPIGTAARWGLFGRKKSASSTTGLVEYSASQVMDNLEHWQTDIALMFYAPWCDYCKQLTPGWTLIKNNLQHGKLELGKFNCEKTTENTDLCQRLGVERYPSLYFFGYGNFHQRIEGVSLAAPLAQRIVKYEGELYLDALYDWVWLLGKLSAVDRGWKSVASSFLNPMANARHKGRIQELEEQVSNYQREISAAATKINRLETLELFDSLKMEGDVFKSMHSEAPSDNNLAFRVCVSELANEYCRYIKDPYCTESLPDCSKTFFESDKCRPEVCPMQPRGCRVVSTCIRPGVIDEFQSSMENYNSGLK